MLSAEQEFVGRLQRTQWLSPAELARYQQPLLERLVRHAATQTEFYSQRLVSLFDGEDSRTAPIDLSKWGSVPVVTRVDAIQSAERMKAREVPSDTGGIRQGESSGSTGRKLQHVRSEIADVVTSCMWDRVYELFELDLRASLAFITFDKEGRYPYPDGHITKGWNHTDPEAVVHLLSLATSPADQLEWLERIRPGHVMAYPIGLREVAEVAIARGSSLRFETFISTGEVLDDQTRDMIERAFGCRAIDIYGIREIGQVAFQCPDAMGYHFCSEATLCEVVDENGDPAPPGEFGRVVLTALYNYAMPFIRYETGDYARVSALPCTCGRGLPFIEVIGGRARNLIVMPDGSKKRLPGVFFHHVSRFLSYRQIQILQETVQSFEVRYQPDAPSVPDVEGLTRLVRDHVHPDAIVKLIPVERIERGTGMKYEQFVSLIPT